MMKLFALLSLLAVAAGCTSTLAPTSGGRPARPSEIYPATTYGEYGSMSLYHKGACAYVLTKITNIPGANYADSSSASLHFEERTLIHQYFVDSMGLSGTDLANCDSIVDTAMNTDYSYAACLTRLAGMTLST